MEKLADSAKTSTLNLDRKESESSSYSIIYNLDDVYRDIGHGKTQRILAYVNAVSRTSGNFFNNQFAFLILTQ